MRYFFLSKCYITLFFFIHSFCQLNAQRGNITFSGSRAISITQLGEDLYVAKNLTEVKLGFYTSTSKRMLYIKPYGYRYFTKNQIGSEHSIFIHFEYERFQKLYKHYTRSAANIEKGRDIFKEIDKKIKEGYSEESDNKIEYDSDSQTEEYIYRLLSFAGSVSAKGAQRSAERNANFYRDLFVATHYSGTLRGGRKVTYSPIDLEFVSKDSDFEHNQRELLGYALGSSVIAPGDNWSPRTSHFIFLGRRIWKGFKWSQRTSSALFVFAAYDSDGYRINNKDKNFFVSRDYVENPTQDFYALKPDETVVIRSNQFSAGLIFRTYTYGSVNLDMGVGYRFSERANIIFDKGLDRFIENANISDNKFKNVIEYEGLPIYGLVSIGKTFGFNRRSFGKPNFRLFLTSRFWQRELLPKDEFQVFEQDGNAFQKISITNEKQLFMTLNFGFGFIF
ncbi:hypothetical protein [Aquimarina aggregata]|uniref:hypothetical protein n=1 Tax=Aquimarina aggregata TaxID=1642818 RepID=UPI002490FB4A|nr:hypothetical protein [Aquimarina aggregata]